MRKCGDERLTNWLDASRAVAHVRPMPFLDPEDARALQTENMEVDLEIDLTAMAREAAMEKLAYELAEGRREGRERVLVRFTPASPTSGETLFLPVGRYLRDEVRTGRAVRAMPAMDGSGWVVRLHARTER